MWKTIPRPIVILAPMAGYTDSAFRQIAKSICKDIICFTEFASVDGIVRGNSASIRQLEFDPKLEQPIVMQIFGSKPEYFYKAAKMLSSLKIAAIDINMGCPAKKIVSSDHGSALLSHPSTAIEVVKAACEGTDLPVSVKTRIGVKKYDPDFFIPFVKDIEKAGAKLITIHGRTASQMFGGQADYSPAYEAKRNLSIPVIGNGDIVTAGDAISKLGNLDGLMIGRAALGNPWILDEIHAALNKNPFATPTPKQKFAAIVRHIDLSIQTKGRVHGMIEMRKHFACYVRGMQNAGNIRSQLVRVNEREEAVEILRHAFLS